MEETEEPMERGLMYVDVWVNNRVARKNIVDSWATHNFITETEEKYMIIVKDIWY